MRRTSPVWLLVAASLAAFLAGPAAAEDDRRVVIAVRTDARPFAWQTEERIATFRGYLVDLCLDATTRAGFHFDLVPVSATEREAVLAGDFTLDGRRIDLLCDPTTITLGRLERLTRADPEAVAFSPIVYVANGSFVRPAARDGRKPCLVGSAEEAHPACARRPATDEDLEAPARIAASADLKIGQSIVVAPAARCLPEGGPIKEYFVAASVSGTTAEETIERAARMGWLGLSENQKICWTPVDGHRKGVEAFCRKRYQYYFGDLDIINAYRRLTVDAGVDCDMAGASRALSYEPYALLITSRNAAYRARLITAIYEIFADGTAASRFDSHFPDYAKSTALELLYRINSIPGLRQPLHGAAEEPAQVSAAASAAPATAAAAAVPEPERPRP